MLRRAWLSLVCSTLVSSLGLDACAVQSPLYAPGHPQGLYPGTAGAEASSNRKVAILLPLSGPLAAVGQDMLQAAQLVLQQPGSPPFQAYDTSGTPSGAAVAAGRAVADGAGIILGPLTASDTAAAAPVARKAEIPMLAFTNDESEARPGVWVLGVTPGQQVRRLIAALQSRGKTRLAALLPENDYGSAMQAAVLAAASSAGQSQPTIQTYTPGMASLNQAVRQLSDYANRRGPIEAQIRAARALETAAGRARMSQLNREPIPPPPFDALLLAATGTTLEEISTLLPYYDLNPGEVQVVGPILWQDPSVRRGAGIAGAWYPAPDPAARQQFAAAYSARYGSAPPFLADLAFDAAALTRVLASGPGFTTAALTNASGFSGVDGVLALLPDGRVKRALAVFQISPGGESTLLDPAPTTLSAPGT